MSFRKLRLPVILLPLLAGGCATSQVGSHNAPRPVQTKFTACHGYGCKFETQIPIAPAVSDRFSAIMASGAQSPEAERAAISKAVLYFEDLSMQRIGVRDLPKSPAYGSDKNGQMDCIDESTNTRHLLLYLQSRGLLKHHKVQSNVSRGFLLDGRYPHWTAVVSDPSGKKWAVDSWFEAGGGAPDIVPLDYWRTRGVMGER
jgi:hypothetical protein